MQVEGEELCWRATTSPARSLESKAPAKILPATDPGPLLPCRRESWHVAVTSNLRQTRRSSQQDTSSHLPNDRPIDSHNKAHPERHQPISRTRWPPRYVYTPSATTAERLRKPHVPVERTASTRRLPCVNRLLTIRESSVRGIQSFHVASASGSPTDTRCSKTFLARLCEQAERYDGTSSKCEAICVWQLLICWCRDGQLHEGMSEIAIVAGMLTADMIDRKSQRYTHSSR